MKLNNVRERLMDLQRDVTVLRRAATPPLAKRHSSIARDCERLDDTLQRYHVELDRLRSVFDTLWQEQLYRIHVEQDIFRTQVCTIDHIIDPNQSISATVSTRSISCFSLYLN